MSLHNEKPPPDEAEPFDLGGLEKYAIKNVCSGLPWRWMKESIYWLWPELRVVFS